MGHIELKYNRNFLEILKLLNDLEAENKISKKSKKELVNHFSELFIQSKKRIIIENYLIQHSNYFTPTFSKINSQLEKIYKLSLMNNAR